MATISLIPFSFQPPCAFLVLQPAFPALFHAPVTAFFLNKFTMFQFFLNPCTLLQLLGLTAYYTAHVITLHQNREDFPLSPLVCRLHRAQCSSPPHPCLCRT